MAETTPSSGPQYAPHDPTLPPPWKALINGSVLYYWNQETNITQYEKPVVPLPYGPLPATTATPKPSSVPVTQQDHSGDMIGHQDLQIMQSAQQGQHINHLFQQHGQVIPQQQPSQMAQTPQQISYGGQSFIPQGQPQQILQQHPVQPQQVLQHPGQPQHVPQHSGMKMPQHFSQHVSPQVGQQTALQPGQEMSTHAVHPMPQQIGQQATQQQVSQMAQPQGHQYMQHHPQFFTYQQSMHQQRPQGMQQQCQQHAAQPQTYPQQQELSSTFSKWEEAEQQGNPDGISSQNQQSSTTSAQNQSAGMNSVPMSHMGGHSGNPQQFSGASINLQMPTPSAPMHQRGNQLNSSGFLNMVSSTTQNPQGNAHNSGLKSAYEESFPERVGNDFYFNPNKEGPIMSPHHPKLAAIPVGRNQQDMMMGAPSQNATPYHVSSGGLNPVPGRNIPNHFNSRTDGLSFSNNSLVGKPATTFRSDVAGPSPSEVYCQHHEVSTMGENVPPPFMTFEATGFPAEILREIHLAGFPSPTPIQAQTWPIALQSRDIVAIAKTGSGKTLGYLIPAFIHLRRRRNNPLLGPSVLVLAPTRELATQIQDEVIKFGRSSRVSCTCLYGGAPKGPQLKELERGADIVVATPGRLNDILEMKKIDFGQISILVLDEADRMLDMGFEPQIRKIVNEIPPHRQTLMYTATWPKEVRKIAGDLLANPVQVNIGSVNELAANKAITQYVEVVPQMEKQRRVEQIVRTQERGAKIIIFCSTKRLCDQLTRSMGRHFGAAAIHGDKSQGERDYVLNQFRSGKTPILVATDVAARGLDIKDIRVVINYDFPTGVDDYVHRIGRTGRAGATGVSYTFFSDQDWKHAADLIKVLEGANQAVPLAVREMAARGGPAFNRDRDGMMCNRFEGGGGRWDSGGRGGPRDGGFRGGGIRDGGSRGGRFRDGGFRGEMRDGGFRGDMRDGGFHGNMRDGEVVGRGGGSFGGFRGNGRGGVHDGRNEAFRGRGRGGFGGFDRNDRGGRGRGRDRLQSFESRRDSRSRGRSYSSSPEKVRTWGYSRSRSRSDSRSRSGSRSRSRIRRRSVSRSRSRSWTRSRSRSWSRSPSRGFSGRGHSYDRPGRSCDLKDSEEVQQLPVVDTAEAEQSFHSLPEP